MLISYIFYQEESDDDDDAAVREQANKGMNVGKNEIGPGRWVSLLWYIVEVIHCQFIDILYKVTDRSNVSCGAVCLCDLDRL